MQTKLLKSIFALMALCSCMLSAQASAYTQCTVSVLKIWSGDQGMIWVHYTNGGSVAISASDPNKVSVLSMAMTALVGGRPLTVRYAADNADCTSESRSDFLGAYLN